MDSHDKEDGSPVTVYDEEMNEVILTYLEEKFPGHSLVGEERQLLTDSQFTWYFDPIDGTKEFIKRNGQWAVQIGLCDKNEVILGFVLHPEINTLYYAEAGQGAYAINLDNDKEERLLLDSNELPSPIKGLISNSHSHDSEIRYLEDSGSKENISLGSFGLKVLAVATGQAHLYPNFRKLIGLWDLCGPQIILTEAGGEFVFEKGIPPQYYKAEDFKVDRKLLAYHPALKDKILCEI